MSGNSRGESARGRERKGKERDRKGRGGEGRGRGRGRQGMGVEGNYMQLTLPSGLCTEYKECFSLYDKEQRGKIKATDLMVVMRCLGASPTPREVQRHLQIHGIGEWFGPDVAAGGAHTSWAGGGGQVL